ncbi:MAG: Cys-tRNA(Pro) deacylase [Chloroflexota bacterium]
MRGSGTRAIRDLERAGIPHALLEYELPPSALLGRLSHRSYGLEAAEALGVAPARIFKTLIVRADAELAVAIVPADLELDLKRLARALGVRRAAMAEPADAERASGYVIGGISPIGQRRPLRAVLDDSASGFELVLVSAGRRGLQVELAPGDLARLVDAVIAPIARRG